MKSPIAPVLLARFTQPTQHGAPGQVRRRRQYARDGKTIEVSVFSDSEAATIQFRDHGPGIPENELPHVKEKFFKGEKHKARGSGIGLAVCDEIITRSGGTLTIANAPGGGTLVSVRLPFAPESGN